jgi:hypothetical protein
LPRLIEATHARIALFLHGWPETFSYTLSEAVAQGLIQRCVVGEAGGVGRALLGENQPDAARLLVMGGEPRLPRRGIRDDELWHLNTHTAQTDTPSDLFRRAKAWWRLTQGRLEVTGLLLN